MSEKDSIRVIIADDAINQLDSVLTDYKRPLIISDVMIFDKYGAHVENLVKADVIWSISPDYKKGLVARFSGVDIILGFGGGKSIDLAKLFASDAGLEWVSVPTAASHDGIASDVASVMHNSYRYSVKCKQPKLVLADLTIISTAPKILTRSGIGDIISKTSSLAEWRLASECAGEPLDEKIYGTVDHSLEAVLRDGGLGTLVRSVIETGMAMTAFGSSRPCSGTEHAISHAMDRRMQSLHGLQVAFATPLSLYFLEEAGYAKHSSRGIVEFMRRKMMPTTLRELDMSRDLFLDDIHHALKIMEKRNRYSVLKHCKATDTDILNAISELNY